eukprot:4708243-Alexandrium_andersonii.AAC.1
MAANDRCLDGPTADRFEALAISCGSFALRANVHLIPKFHMAVHLATQSRLVGNAKFVSTYEDESHNRDLVT